MVAADLRHLPLFRALSDEQLKTLLGVFSPRKIARGHTLFSAGETTSTFQILTEGEIELAEPNEPKLSLLPINPIGELGALTGLPRNATATALSDSRILEVPTEKLMEVFARSNDLARLFYQSLLGVVSEKLGRDKQRADDMRRNIIRTQKAMKELREIILSAEETPISQPICDKLDDLIEHNRRAHYRVTPLESHPATLRFEPGPAEAALVELSQGFVKLHPKAASNKLEPGVEIVGVLTLPRGAIPVSGKIERVGTDGILVKLDLLIDEYASLLNRYMNELQLLDFVI